MAAKEEVEAETPPVQDDVPEEKKDVIPSPQGKIDDSKALVLVDKTSDSTPKKNSGGSLDRACFICYDLVWSIMISMEHNGAADFPTDIYMVSYNLCSISSFPDIALANLEKEKSLSFVRAWEESEKTKAENKAQKKLSDVTAWENSKKVSLEAKLQKLEEEYDRKKAEYAEKMKNKVALIHKVAEEKRAIVEAKRGEEVLKAEEVAAKFRATRTVPKKLLGCF